MTETTLSPPAVSDALLFPGRRLGPRPAPAMAERIPNFFIVGAPKAGTTALYQFLRAHPQIFMPKVKEPTFFCADLDPSFPYAIRERETYLSLFRDAPSESQVGEATVWYLYSQEAARAIGEFNPDARIIAMLRNPVEAMPSLHGQLLWTGDEDIYDFREALEAEDDRSHGRRLPIPCEMPRGTLYRRVYRYAEQLQRYIDVFGRDRIHVVIYDDLKARPDESYREILRFLSVDEGFQPPFQTVNPSFTIRYRRLHRLMVRPPEWMQRTMQAVLPPGLREALYWRIMCRIVTKNGRPPLDPELRMQLMDECAPEIGKLGELLRRDLTSWMRAV